MASASDDRALGSCSRVTRCSNRCSWRDCRRRGRRQYSALSQAPPGSSSSIIDDLPTARSFVSSCADGQALVDEASNGSRRKGLRLFFEGLDASLAEMLKPQNEAAPSEHGFGREAFIKILKDKCKTLVRLGRAERVVVFCEDSGFFSPWLVVFEALLFAMPNAAVFVDWRLDGTEKHFSYSSIREPHACVWSQLYEPIDRPAEDGQTTLDPSASVGLKERFNMFLSPRFRCLQRRSRFEAAQRDLYNSLYTKWVHLKHPRIVEEVNGGLGKLLAGGRSLGVHKRVWTPGTAEYQGSRFVYSIQGFVTATKILVEEARREGRPFEHLFVATDDTAAVTAFTAAFGDGNGGPLLHLRGGVTRVGGGLNASDATLNEVHIKSPHNPSCNLEDAADVIIDAELLARCKTCLHMDSNVTSAVSIISNLVEMRHIIDVLAGHEAPRALLQRPYYSIASPGEGSKGGNPDAA